MNRTKSFDSEIHTHFCIFNKTKTAVLSLFNCIEKIMLNATILGKNIFQHHKDLAYEPDQYKNLYLASSFPFKVSLWM